MRTIKTEPPITEVSLPKRKGSRRRKNTPRTRVKRKKDKLPTLSKLKRETDKYFSLFIRAKYPKECYTCGNKGTLQCGHFISRLYLATRWEESNARPQCVGCNIWGRGKPLDFEERLKKEIGAEKVEEMKLRRKELIKPNRAFFQEQIKKYTSLLEELS